MKPSTPRFKDADQDIASWSSYTLVACPSCAQRAELSNSINVFQSSYWNEDAKIKIKCTPEAGAWLAKILTQVRTSSGGDPLAFSAFQQNFQDAGLRDFDLFWPGQTVHELRGTGLVLA